MVSLNNESNKDVVGKIESESKATQDKLNEIETNLSNLITKDYNYLPKMVQALLEKENYDKFLSNPFLKLSTMPINYFYVGAAYNIFGLYAMFTGQMATHMGAECPSILNQEWAMLRTYGKVPPPYICGDEIQGGGVGDAPGFLTVEGDRLVIKENHTQNNYFNEDVQLMLDIVNEPLAVERQMGHPISDGYIQHSKIEKNDSGGLNFTVGLDKVCFSQYLPGSVWLTKTSIQESAKRMKTLGINPNYDETVFTKNQKLAESLITKVDNACGITLDMYKKDGTAYFTGNGFFGVESYLLVLIHGFTALIVNNLVNDIPVQIVDWNTYSAGTKFFTGKTPNDFNITGLGFGDADGKFMYYYTDEVEILADETKKYNFYKWARPLIFSYLKMTRNILSEEYNLDPTDLFNIQNQQQPESLSTGGLGFTLPIPKESKLYKRFTSNDIYKNYPGY